MILEIHPTHPQQRLIAQACREIDRGALFIYPTDTVYGLGCDVENKKGIDRIFKIKDFERSKLLSFVFADFRSMAQYAQISDYAFRMMKWLLPGPYTFVLEAKRKLPKAVLSKRKTVGVRVPDNPICQAIVETLGRPILSTSATLDDEWPSPHARDLAETFRNHVELVIDGGPISRGPSTVVDLVGDEPVILREGLGDTGPFAV